MSIPATIALVSAALAIYVAALCNRLSLAPGWRDQRWFSLAAVTVAVFAALDVSATCRTPAAVVIWCSRLQIVMAGVHAFAWIRYSDLHLGARPGPVGDAVRSGPLVLGALALLPGVVFRDAVRSHAFAPLGVVYADTVPTAFGEVTLGVLTGVFLLLSARYALAWRRGVPHAAVHLFSLLFLVTMVTNDALVTAGVVATPYLINIGFILPIGAVAYAMTTRFAADARALQELRDGLEFLVQERTRALALAQERLHRSEKLAALGQLAAGVAHEVNNPAAAAAANLRHLLDSHASGGAWPDDARDCLDDSMSAILRIRGIVRQLLDAGRLAAAPSGEPVSLARAARESLRMSRATSGGRVQFLLQVDEQLRAVAQEGTLIQVLLNLIQNGVQAIPAHRRDGCVVVRSERAEGQVRLVVEDNGPGLPPDVLRRAFEPFFTTKPFGCGTGLGLAVSRGLVQGLGGDLRLENLSGGGARAVIELPDGGARDHGGAQLM